MSAEFLAIVFAAGVLGGGLAAIAGAGIGSIVVVVVGVLMFFHG